MAVAPPEPQPSVGGFVDEVLDTAPTTDYPLFGTPLSRGSDPGTVQSRMHLYYAGKFAIGMTGDEGYAAELLSMIAVDAVTWLAAMHNIVPFDMVRPDAQGRVRGRTLVVPGGLRTRSSVIFMPEDYTGQQPRRATQEFMLDHRSGLGFGDLGKVVDLAGLDGPLEDIYRKLLYGHPDDIRDVLTIVQPEIIVTRQPKMIPLSVPAPSIGVDCPPEVSSMGVFCRDAQGEFGVTTCYHGTGGPGTRVSVGGFAATVKSANNVQDLAFVPVPRQNFGGTGMVGGGEVRTSAPGIDDPASFDGVTSGHVGTMVSSYDRGLLRKSPKLQLKLQTPPDTNAGDSGAALIISDRIVAFAFNKTAFDEKPAMSEWIWAANALDSLQLRPCAP